LFLSLSEGSLPSVSQVDYKATGARDASRVVDAYVYTHLRKIQPPAAFNHPSIVRLTVDNGMVEARHMISATYSLSWLDRIKFTIRWFIDNKALFVDLFDFFLEIAASSDSPQASSKVTNGTKINSHV
jgi:hypothetical protein